MSEKGRLASAFAGLQEPEHLSAPEPRSRGAQAPKRLSPEAPKPLPLQGVAKSAHPDFAPVKVYLRKRTRLNAEHKYKSSGGEDFSDLVEDLLQKYLSA